MKYLKRFTESKITDTLKNIYTELNPVLKVKKMNKYHKELKDEVEKMEKELEEKKKSLDELNKRINK
jgi:cell division septum initiation protein DivIVA